ncbi:MAG: hypothetical protein LBS94_01250 [Prevotellaceae bacterium]|jgi:hypothetical protein|nr:hypothetical protein [Prevotellaceae bacterium]
MEKSKYKYVDPPEGWKYGFPKLYDGEIGESLKKWCIKKGYKPSFNGWDRYIRIIFSPEKGEDLKI